MKRCMNMYEKSLNDLNTFLQLIADLDVELELFALGGTAMVLGKIKEATKDIDFLTTARYEDIKRWFTLAGLKEESPSIVCNIWSLGDTIRVDIFYDAFILGVPLPDDWKELSHPIRSIGKVRLFVLNWYDVIITKIARSEPRDIEDILAILKKEDIDFQKLKARYYGLAETSLIADYDYKFKHLELKKR